MAIKDELKSRSSQEKEDVLLKDMKKDEVDGVKMYKKLISLCDDPEKRKVYEYILNQEKHHVELLSKIKE